MKYNTLGSCFRLGTLTFTHSLQVGAGDENKFRRECAREDQNAKGCVWVCEWEETTSKETSERVGRRGRVSTSSSDSKPVF